MLELARNAYMRKGKGAYGNLPLLRISATARLLLILLRVVYRLESSLVD